jgi:Tol biopolymer transport system component
MGPVQRVLAAVAAVAIVATAAPASAYPRPGRTAEVTVIPGGNPGSGAPSSCSSSLTCSAQVDITPDGRYVAFNSPFTDLVPDDTNGVQDVFVRDLHAGVTERVSIGLEGEANNGSAFPSLSDDGRLVAFLSDATNLTPTDSPGTDVFVYDRAAETTRFVSVAPDGRLGSGQSARDPRISGDGRFVAFYSNAFGDDTTNDARLPVGGGVNFGNVYVHDLAAGRTELVSVTETGARSTSVSVYGSNVDISRDGRFVVWDSRRHDLVAGDTNGMVDVFVRDRVARTTRMISIASSGQQGNWMSYNPRISADGSVVAFSAGSSNLVPTDTNSWARSAGGIDVFTHDLTSGRTERISVTESGQQLAPGSDAYWLDVSPDGRYVAFDSPSATLSENAEARRILYVHDRITKATERVSVPDGAAQFTQSAFASPPAISTDGSAVVFAADSPTTPFDNAVYVRRRGAPLDVVDARATPEGSDVRVSGRATFAGRVISSDAAGAADPDGLHATSARVIARPESEDLLFVLDVAGMATTGSLVPGANYATPSEGGLPGAAYTIAFSLDGERYEVRAARLDDAANPRFALFRCAAACAHVSDLAGGLGTAGEDVRIDVPLAKISAVSGSRITSVRVASGLGSLENGVAAASSEFALPDAAIPVPSVRVGWGDGSYRLAALDGPTFTATTPGPGPVHVRACLDDICSDPVPVAQEAPR